MKILKMSNSKERIESPRNLVEMEESDRVGKEHVFSLRFLSFVCFTYSFYQILLQSRSRNNGSQQTTSRTTTAFKPECSSSSNGNVEEKEKNFTTSREEKRKEEVERERERERVPPTCFHSLFFSFYFFLFFSLLQSLLQIALCFSRSDYDSLGRSVKNRYRTYIRSLRAS